MRQKKFVINKVRYRQIVKVSLVNIYLVYTYIKRLLRSQLRTVVTVWIYYLSPTVKIEIYKSERTIDAERLITRRSRRLPVIVIASVCRERLAYRSNKRVINRAKIRTDILAAYPLVNLDLLLSRRTKTVDQIDST